MIRKLSLTAAAAVLAASPVLADTYVIDKSHSEASFQVRHLMSKVRGNFNDYAGTISVDPAKPESASVEFTIKSASIDTSNENRDKDLRGPNFFDVEKFPTLTFTSTSVKAKDANNLDVTGDLTIHGVTKRVTIPVTVLGTMKMPNGEKGGFETAFTINRKDYGIVWNRVLDTGGSILGDDVKIAIGVEGNLQEAPKATK